MFGKRIGFLKFTADVYDKATGKKVYDHVVFSLCVPLWLKIRTQTVEICLTSISLRHHFELGRSTLMLFCFSILFIYLMQSSSYFCSN